MGYTACYRTELRPALHALPWLSKIFSIGFYWSSSVHLWSDKSICPPLSVYAAPWAGSSVYIINPGYTYQILSWIDSRCACAINVPQQRGLQTEIRRGLSKGGCGRCWTAEPAIPHVTICFWSRGWMLWLAAERPGSPKGQQVCLKPAFLHCKCFRNCASLYLDIAREKFAKARLSYYKGWCDAGSPPPGSTSHKSLCVRQDGELGVGCV